MTDANPITPVADAPVPAKPVASDPISPCNVALLNNLADLVHIANATGNQSIFLKAINKLLAAIQALKQSQPAGATTLANSLDENELWNLLDAVCDALSRKAAPHAWESIVRMAGHDFIVKRREAAVKPQAEKQS